MTLELLGVNMLFRAVAFRVVLRVGGQGEGNEPQMPPKPYRQKGRPIPWRMIHALNITKAPMLVSTDA